RPLGVSQNESVHLKLESQSSSNENPESKQALGRPAHPAPETGRDDTSLDRLGIVALTTGKLSDFNT
ncbi:hypothetical protein, partial [Bradyrhizobium sp. LA2.1]|uniref:hypothetical protein n=1 Tax=Bradyrhizobium sp. LA2.1 TaxID=3156376 RepID=UPI003393B816